MDYLKSKTSYTKIEYKDMVIAFAKRKYKPILIGEVSLMFSWSLSKAEELVNEMVDEGILRPVTKIEGRQFGLPFGYFLIPKKPTKPKRIL